MNTIAYDIRILCFPSDVIYQGGITEFKKSAEIIARSNRIMSAHLFHELSVSLAGLCDQHFVEHIDFFPDDLFVHDFSIIDGKINLPKTPGHGAAVTDQAIDRYTINDTIAYFSV